jgi:hypothetical protein
LILAFLLTRIFPRRIWNPRKRASFVFGASLLSLFAGRFKFLSRYPNEKPPAIKVECGGKFDPSRGNYTKKGVSKSNRLLVK